MARARVLLAAAAVLLLLSHATAAPAGGRCFKRSNSSPIQTCEVTTCQGTGGLRAAGHRLLLLLLLQPPPHPWEEEQRAKLGAAAKAGGDAAQRKADFVRPGRFLGTLHAMVSELECVGGGGQGGAVLQRLQGIELEALAVLDRIQRA
jgi:hypothetical protein